MKYRKHFCYVEMHQVFAKNEGAFFHIPSPFPFSTRPFPIETSIPLYEIRYM